MPRVSTSRPLLSSWTCPEHQRSAFRHQGLEQRCLRQAHRARPLACQASSYHRQRRAASDVANADSAGRAPAGGATARNGLQLVLLRCPGSIEGPTGAGPERGRERPSTGTAATRTAPGGAPSRPRPARSPRLPNCRESARSERGAQVRQLTRPAGLLADQTLALLVGLPMGPIHLNFDEKLHPAPLRSSTRARGPRRQRPRPAAVRLPACFRPRGGGSEPEDGP